MTVAADHPRPQLRRAEWTSLDGVWDFALDPEGTWRHPDEVDWDRTITVPFAPETPASGIAATGFFRVCWYRRVFDASILTEGERLMLRFGAVDFAARMWINGRFAGDHEGGSTPFAIELTGLRDDGQTTIVVRAEDDPHDLAKQRGKQDWRREPHGIWYPRTTGIWQTVWLERLPATAIATACWTANLERWEIGLGVELSGQRQDDLRLAVRLTTGGGDGITVLADDVWGVDGDEVERVIRLPDPGIGDQRDDLLWSPEAPTLIDARLRLLGPGDAVIDEVASYTAMRAVSIDGNRFLLNGRPYPLRLVLDQGYWPESGLTAPTPEALRRDVELTKAMGFNGARKHQKIEDPRYLGWADRLGLLVWGEMPSAYRFSQHAVERLSREWQAAIARDWSHPCLVAWVPFNESWGVPDLPRDPAQRDYVRAIYHLTKTLDPSRPVIANDGWENAATDLIGIHDYDEDPATLLRRYGTAGDLAVLFDEERPAGRVLTLPEHPYAGQPIILSEFGGIAFTPAERQDETWGYVRAETAEQFAERYAALLAAARQLTSISGFCYTQFADTYQEANGLLFADRTPKLPLDTIALATRGPKSRRQEALERRQALSQRARPGESE